MGLAILAGFMGLATLAGFMGLATLGAFKTDFTLFYQHLFQ
jgi:hypothetical protein